MGLILGTLLSEGVLGFLSTRKGPTQAMACKGPMTQSKVPSNEK